MAEKNIQQAFDRANAYIAENSNESGLFTMVLCPDFRYKHQIIARVNIHEEGYISLRVTQNKKNVFFTYSELSALFALLYSFRDILLPEQE